ncbi:MAG: ATP-binding protein [Candidatus Peribacteraceae bacterium]|nr:ATP-binding protein [Candidatus Peribacteraceae bacterium]
MNAKERAALLNGGTFVLGIRGSGKTTYARKFVQDLSPKRLLIISATSDWDSFVTREQKKPLYGRDFYRRNHRVAFNYPHIINKDLSMILTHGNFYIIFDDLDAFVQMLRDSNYKLASAIVTKLNYLALMGRHKNIGFLVISHRLHNIPQNLLSEAYRVVCFSLHHPGDMRDLSVLLGREYRLDVAQLKGHEFREYNFFLADSGKQES